MDDTVIAPWWFRLLIWMLIVGTGMVVACPDPAGGYLILLYPLGIGFLFGENPGWGGGTLGYLAHVILFAAMLSYRRLGAFMMVCSLLILLCFGTTFGCRKAIPSIHFSGGLTQPAQSAEALGQLNPPAVGGPSFSSASIGVAAMPCSPSSHGKATKGRFSDSRPTSRSIW